LGRGIARPAAVRPDLASGFGVVVPVVRGWAWVGGAESGCGGADDTADADAADGTDDVDAVGDADAADGVDGAGRALRIVSDGMGGAE